MIYYFKALKSPVDTKPKNALIPRSISRRRPWLCPDAALLRSRQKGILILLTEIMEGNNGREKNKNNFNYDYFILLKLCFDIAGGLINDMFGSQRLLKMCLLIVLTANRLT